MSWLAFFSAAVLGSSAYRHAQYPARTGVIPCPNCTEPLRLSRKRCPHCGEPVEAAR